MRYAARAVVKPMNLRQIARQMVREGSKYAEHEILGVAEQMIDVIIDRLRHGASVNFGSMMRFRPSIKGGFESATEPFDAKKHQLKVAVSAGPWLRNALDGVAVEPMVAVTFPQIIDVEVGEAEDANVVQLFGRHLYRKDLGKGSQWLIRSEKKSTELRPLAQKRNGREVMFVLDGRIYPPGTTVIFVLRVKEGKAWQEYASEAVTL